MKNTEPLSLTIGIKLWQAHAGRAVIIANDTAHRFRIDMAINSWITVGDSRGVLIEHGQ